MGSLLMLVGRSEKKLKRKEKEKEKRGRKKRERREVSEDLPANSTMIFECQKPKVREGGEKRRFVHLSDARGTATSSGRPAVQ